MISSLAKTRDLRLTTSLDPDLPMLRGDERVITQVLNNLLSNAVKFTAADGAIDVSAKVRENGSVNILVSDTGEGMSERDIVKATRPFEQADSTYSRRHEGTGLGLHLCQNFIKLHGGSLDIESEEGKGTTVTVRFPPDRTVSV